MPQRVGQRSNGVQLGTVGVQQGERLGVGQTGWVGLSVPQCREDVTVEALRGTGAHRG